jgi:hypothetical protein
VLGPGALELLLGVRVIAMRKLLLAMVFAVGCDQVDGRCTRVDLDGRAVSVAGCIDDGAGGAGAPVDPPLPDVWPTPPACDPQPADVLATEGYYQCPEGSPSQYAIPRGICMDIRPEKITVRSGCTVTKDGAPLWVCAGASCD